MVDYEKSKGKDALKAAPQRALLALPFMLVLACTGFLMGFSMISSLLANSAEARQKADDLYHTLTPFQVPLGLVSIALGVWALFA